MSPSRFAAIVGTTSVLVLFAHAVTGPFGLVWSGLAWYRVGAVYALSLLLAGAVLRRRGRPPEFLETVGIASLSVTGVATVSLFQSSSPLPLWILVPFHLNFLVPAAFMLPLGAATTWRQRLGTVGVIILPALYYLLYSFVLQPARIAPYPNYGTPAGLILSTTVFFSFFAAAGGPLLVLGRLFARGNRPFREATRRLSPAETG